MPRGGYDRRVDAAETFHKLVGGLEYPMFIVTARAGDERLGCLVGFATQTSIDPPRFAVCLSHNNRTYRHGRDSDHLGVHCVPEHATELAELFGGETGDEVDKFARCRWRPGPSQVPVLEDCVRWFAGEVVDQIPTDDHVGFVLAPIHAQSGPWAGQLGFQSAKAISPGHEA